MTAKVIPNYINHVTLVLDASGSMQQHAPSLIKVTDGLIAHLARRSQELDQETRVSIYTFDDTVRCIIYDKDVLRLPSLQGLYLTGGRTALIDATLLALRDLALTPTKYGDHAFLAYVLTDGEENASREDHGDLSAHLASLPDSWTVAALVPNAMGRHEAKRFGFPADNIGIWDASSTAGVEEVGRTITAATDAYMTMRSTGGSGTRNLFSMNAQTINAKTVAASGLTPLPKAAFTLTPVPRVVSIREFVLECGHPFRVGAGYYQLTKPEKVQPDKAVAIMRTKTREVFIGDEARQLLGLPDVEIKVMPEHNPEYTIFVQSKSVNRNLMPGTHLLYLTR